MSWMIWTDWYQFIPEWARYVIAGLIMFAQMVFATIIVSRTGRTPYWALLAIVPLFYILLIGTWALAFCRWPRFQGWAAVNQTPEP